MGGGKLQLSITGKEDKYLSNNPNINIFKSVYMRHTNFTMCSIEESCLNYIKNDRAYKKNLEIHNNTIYNVKIPRNGDLINDIFLRIDLPAINYVNSTHIEYAKYPGIALIDSISLYIETTKIQTLTGEYIYAYHQLNNDSSKKEIYEKMIGENRDIYRNNENYFSNNTNNNLSYIPPINLCIPIPFWFSKSKGLSLPLIALQNHEVTIRIKLRPFKDILLERKNNILVKCANPSTYITNWDDCNVQSRLDINYIFLDNKERKFICNNTQQYLIEQTQYYTKNDLTSLETINLKLYHPIKEIIILPRRNDAKNHNEWFNFTNLDEVDQDFTIYQEYKNHTGNYLNNKSDINTYWRYRKNTNIPAITSNNHTFYTKNIINEMSIMLDQNSRVKNKYYNYYNLNQQFDHYNGNYLNGALIYSFAKYPSKFQPTGVCNLSEITDLTIHMNLKNPKIETNNIENYKYDILICLVSYNILDIRNGRAGLIYSN